MISKPRVAVVARNSGIKCGYLYGNHSKQIQLQKLNRVQKAKSNNFKSASRFSQKSFQYISSNRNSQRNSKLNMIATQKTRGLDFQRKKETNYSRRHDWYFLASELAFNSSFLGILGCLMAFSVHYTFNNDASFYACIPVFILSLPVILIEWNRPLKRNGRKVPPRYFNGIFELSSLDFLNKKFDKISENQFWIIKHFLFRAVFYLMLAAGCFVNIATHLAFYGFGLSGIIYLLGFLIVGKDLKMNFRNVCYSEEEGGKLENNTNVVPGRRKARMQRIQSHGMKRGSICYFDKEQVFKPKAERTMSIARRASTAREIGMRRLKQMLSMQAD